MVTDDAAGEALADRRAVALVARGDAAALGELYDRHASAIYALALRIVAHRADAEEVVQDVFTQAWRQSARYDTTRASVAGWLLMMTRARAIDRLRATQSRPDTSAADLTASRPPAVQATQEAEVMDVQRVHAVKGALRALPAVLRTPIELAYYEGLSHSEIAVRLEEPLGTVKTRIRTALMKLRDVLQQGGAS